MPEYTVSVCGNCGVYINETFYADSEFRATLFGAEYYNTNVAFDQRADAWRADPSLPFYTRFLEPIEREIGRGRVMDVGCAFGNFLKLAQDRGWSPCGVELSPYSSEVARRTGGFPVHTGVLCECPQAPGSLDLVTFWDVIEHVVSPAADLRKARELLRTGGRLVLATDNAAGLIAHLGAWLYRLTGGRWSYPVRKFFIKFNSVFFTAEQLSHLLEQTGFRTLRVEPVDYPLAKLNVSGPERLLVAALYAAGRLFRRQSQFVVVAEAV
jgi:2-polyprenyl-3-methyl-5-hydroxy-6-metoxy-1,4-benzoquinol methylase